MKGAQVVVVAAARLFTPLMALFAMALLAMRAAGDGVGFVAGLAFGLLLVLHALTFGAEASRIAFPPPMARVFLALGLAGVCVGAGLPEFLYAAQLIEAGAFALTVSGGALIVQTLFGRAPTLRDGEW
ncbi:MAG: MnhB domain-containing protein [Terricaulis sp.]|mgnify:CR=1 FL=1